MSGAARLRLGTRGSTLALTQSRWVAERIRRAGAVEAELVTIRTTGDRAADRPLSEIGGKGVFTRELDRAVLDGEVDVAVHSLKDLPTVLPEGLVVGGVPVREDPGDVLLVPHGSERAFADLPSGAVVGTGSLRRRALLLAHRADLEVAEIRGNLDTRIGKLDAGEYDALVLAAAGLRRMRWDDRVAERLDPGSWIPAPGQGALGLVARAGDEEVLGVLARVDDRPSRAATAAERTLLHRLEAGCRLPVGALGLPFGEGLRLRAVVASPDGRQVVRAEATGTLADPEGLGARVADRLLERGADAILAEVRSAPTTSDPSYP